MKKKRQKLIDFLYPAAGILLILLIWEVVVRALEVPIYLVPPPSKIFLSINSGMLVHLKTTFVEALAGFMIANITGFLVAILFVHCRPLEKTLFPIAIALKTTPIVAIAPLLVVWLGTGTKSKIVASGIICFFPILVNSVHGLKAIEEESLELFKTYGASKREIFFRLRLITSLPYVMSALKISSSLAVVGAIVGEFVGSTKGIGYQVLTASYHLDTPQLFSAIFASALIGMFLFAVVGFIEKKVASWCKEEIV